MRQMQALITADLGLPTAPTVQSSRPTRRDVRARAASRLKTYLTYLGNDPTTIPFQLLKLHIAERSMLPVAMDAEQPVELIQVSANTRSLLDPSRRSAKDKLTGMQLNHFGAFYKRSWRANDWMWGRLDGAGWLVHVLLDPRRILAVVDADATYPAGRRAETFVSRLETRFPELPKSDAEGKPHRNAALEELKFLDDDAERIPASIPATALWLAWAWHVEIANAELPVVATEMLATPTRRDTRWAMNVVKLAGKEQEAVAAAKQAVAAVSAGNSTRVANRMIRHAEQPLAANRALLYRELPNCPVPDEKLSDERGEPLFARTLAQTAAVATAAMTAIEGTPATLRPALSGARTVTLTAYRAVDITGAVPKRLLVAGVLASAVGVFLAVQHSSLLGMTGTLLLLTGLYLIALGAWGLSKRAIPVLGTITVITAITALCLPFGRRHLYGTGADDPGWLSKTVEPWLRNSWWAGLAAIAIIVAIGGLWGFIASLMSHKASAKHRRSHQSKAEKKMEGANKKVRRTQTVPPVAP
jgi:hypothetical protein